MGKGNITWQEVNGNKKKPDDVAVRNNRLENVQAQKRSGVHQKTEPGN